MKTIFLFLILATASFSQIDKKKEVKTIPKIVEAKKTLELKTKAPKIIDSKVKVNINDIKKVVIKSESELKLNDTIVTITKKSIASAPIEEKNLSYDVGFRLLNSCNTSKIKKFTEFELTGSLLKKIRLSYISAICVNNNEEYGKFIRLELAEVLTNENILTNIYRFKIEYDRKLLKKEMRIYINNQGLVSVIK
ncbi:MAG: hypothetical protein H7174_03215, partial [Flavobacterium sp.]|nr:hypothetical protein [Flavobacterium sp.]